MKNLNNYIIEKLHINKDSNSKKPEYHYHPEKLSELMELLIKLVNERGSDADLNDVDVSRITDMSNLFQRVNYFSKYKIKFIDISKWDVSNVKDMDNMFTDCDLFSCDLSDWDVSNVEDFESMFERCSKFTSDLSRWDFSSAKKVKFMFLNCTKFNSEVGEWKFNPELTSMLRMFDGCESFEGDGLDKWDVSNIKDFRKTFLRCTSLHPINNLNGWKLNKHAVIEEMFRDCGNITKPNWYKEDN